MATISRLNTTIGNHTAISNAVGFSLLAVACIISAAAITRSGQLAQTAYDTPSALVPVMREPVAGTQAGKTRTVPTALTVSAAPTITSLSDSNQQPSAAATPQLAIASANDLQPSNNTLQLTGTTPQDAAGV